VLDASDRNVDHVEHLVDDEAVPVVLEADHEVRFGAAARSTMPNTDGSDFINQYFMSLPPEKTVFRVR
jgi:hypothetical protein